VLIDWFTVIAQIVNFIVLVLLLKRFRDGPILRAIDEREAGIAAELQAAEQKAKEAALEAEVYRRRNIEFEEQRDELVRQAKEEVQAWRGELMQRVHHEAQEAQSHWRRVLEEEKTAFLRQLRQRVCHQSYVIARQVLAEMANADLERQVVAVFAKRLAALEGDELAAIAQEVRQLGQEVVVTSAFPLADDQRQAVRAAVEQHLGHAAGLRFAVSPDLICGIELRTQGHRVAWSLADYLATLEVQALTSLPDVETQFEAWNGR
jgi:F-type H+-transporting ATPase subunit b